MKYVKPFGEYIEFDNSDVIVTSRHDLDCTSARNHYAYCTSAGDSDLQNMCGNDGLNCTLVSNYECRNLWDGKCNSSGNQIFFNSTGPGATM